MNIRTTEISCSAWHIGSRNNSQVSNRKITDWGTDRPLSRRYEEEPQDRAQTESSSRRNEEGPEKHCAEEEKKEKLTKG